MSNKLNIEELFREKFDGYKVEPSGGAYAKIQRAYNRRQFLRFNPRRLNIYYTLGTILIGTAVAFTLFTSDQSNIKEPQTTNTPTQTENLNSESNSQSLTSEAPRTPSPSAEAQRRRDPEPSNTEQNSQAPIIPDSSHPELDSGPHPVRRSAAKEEPATNPQPLPDSTSNPQSPTATKEQTVSTMVAYFIPSTHEGCAPLTVQFTNLSTNATSYSWNFGKEYQNSGNSVNEDQNSKNFVNEDQNSSHPELDSGQPATCNLQPATVYSEPGTYTVTLTATNNTGHTLTHSETITVHPTPKADFEITDNYIYNYSSDATTYKWLHIAADTFEVSSDFQIPLSEAQINPQPATRNPSPPAIAQRRRKLALIATNIHNCSDTTTKVLPKPSSPSLAFPSAFSPNPDGPTGGFFSPTDINNNVFHPFFNEEPLEYNLKIFSKSGELIFESDDIYKGWDGYYKQQPSPKGVYIYQVSGQWKNGKPFECKGDITLILND